MRDFLFKTFLPRDPISRSFGFDRGRPIDRYFIEKFFTANRNLIQGKVLEIGDRDYTLRYGQNVSQSTVFGHELAPGVDAAVNLEADEIDWPKNDFDSVILTQTLQFCRYPEKVLSNVSQLLKPEGNLLLSVPGITQISRYDEDRWGQYFSFMPKGLSDLVSRVDDLQMVKTEVFGNAGLCCSFLMGLSADEIKEADLEHRDPDYPLIMLCHLVKSKNRGN